MRVSDLMTAALISDSPEDTVSEASAKMWQQQTGSLLIMENESLIGILTERDVLRVVAEGADAKGTSVRDVMTKDPVTISPDHGLHEAASIMFERWFRHLPVVSGNGDIVGVISLRDLLTLVSDDMTDADALRALAGHQLVRDKRLQIIEAGDLD